MTENTKLGCLLARLRGERGLTQGELAKACGLSRTQIARIETGVQGKGDISLRAASGLAKAFGVTVSQFVAMVDAEEVADATVARRPGRPAKPMPDAAAEPGPADAKASGKPAKGKRGGK